jgi:TolB-like protein
MAKPGGRKARTEGSPLDRRGPLSAILAELASAPQKSLGGRWDRWLRRGAVVGRFELVRELGRGGFGVVWEARDRELGRAVAFKAVRATDRAALRQELLLREAEAAARLSHPNIVTLYDVGRSEHGPYLVLELLRGRTLGERLADGPLPAHDAVRVAVEIARGLAHAHAAGVVHRDLKPGNVVLCDDGRVKVLDFGLAHAFGRRRAAGGTPAYMAPEQRRGAPEDERTDVFALGVMLHEMISGRRPSSKRSGVSPRPPRLDVAAAPELAALVECMLARDPVRRPRDGAEVLASLERIAASLAAARGVGAAPARPRRARTAPRRRGSTGIAVLPFSSLGPPDDAYFAEGIHDELLRALTRIGELKVISRTSVLQYRDGARNLREIGEALGVTAIVEGSVQRVGDRVRVEAKLAEARTDRQIWAERYDRHLTDVFAIETAVAEEIAGALEARLTRTEKSRLQRRPTGSTEAYDCYLRAREYDLRPGLQPLNLHAAEQLYRRAVALDPSFALARARLAQVNAWTYWMAVDASPARLADAQREAGTALALQPDLAEAHASLGAIHYVRRAYDDALREYERARSTAPGDASTLMYLGFVERRQGKFADAHRHMEEAVALDPRSAGNMDELGNTLTIQRRYAEAVEAYDRALSWSPDYVAAAVNRAHVQLLWKGETAPAKAAIARFPAGSDPGGTLTAEKYLLELFKALPVEAWAVLSALPLQAIRTKYAVVPKTLLGAQAAEAQGDLEGARPLWDAARDQLEREARAAPDDFRLRPSLGRAYAGLGRRDDALREGMRAVELLPISKDAFDGSVLLEDLAAIHARVGDEDAAIAEIERLLSIPSYLSPALLRIDPKWTPLRADRRFQRFAGP